MDQDTLETVLRYGIPIVIVATVGAVGSWLRGRRGRRRLLESLRARGATVAEGKAALQWPPSPAALAGCGEITWSAHLASVELGLYGGARGFVAVALTWASSRSSGEWMLVSDPGVPSMVKKLGWTEVGEQVLGFVARAKILVPTGAPPPVVPDGLALAIKQTLGARRELALHATGGKFHLVILDPGELDEPLEYWIAASGAVDRGFAVPVAA